MGRPKKKIDPVEVERLAGEGLAEYQVAAQLGVSADTFATRKRDTPAVADALKRGKQAARGKIENVAFSCALKAGDDPRYQTALIFWLKANAGWKETQVVEQVKHDGYETREEIAGRIRALLAGDAAEEGADWAAEFDL